MKSRRRTLPRPTAMAAFAVISMLASACSTWSGFARPHEGQLRQRLEVPLPAARASLHLARPSGGRTPPVLLFHVTGDAGWLGLDPVFFDTMAARGYALAGLSARVIHADLRAAANAATPARLAADYLALIAAAQARLQLPADVPVVLTGLSRGANLAVVAATQPDLGGRLAGVLAMGVTGEEGNVRPAVAPFALVGSVNCPLVVLQSTVDRHVPAAEARRRFGPDAPGRRLVPIEAKSHTFGGHHEDLFREAEAAIEAFVQRKQ